MTTSDFIVPMFFALIFGFIVYFSLEFVVNLRKVKSEVISQFSSLNKYSIDKKIQESESWDPSFNYNFIPRRMSSYIKHSLDLIHSNLKYEVVVSELLLSAAIIAFLLTLTGQSLLISFVLSLLVTTLGFRQVIRTIQNRQRDQFREDLPDLLNILAGGLRAGLSLHQALEAYTNENTGEVATQMRRAISEISIGNPIDISLMGVAERMKSEDLKWTVTALTIQKSVGGSMATILETAYETVLGRAEINREIHTISAEGRLSGYVLMALPVGIFFFMLLTRREYVEIFWTDPIGLSLLVFVTLSIGLGWIWMRRVVEIRI